MDRHHLNEPSNSIIDDHHLALRAFEHHQLHSNLVVSRGIEKPFTRLSIDACRYLSRNSSNLQSPLKMWGISNRLHDGTLPQQERSVKEPAVSVWYQTPIGRVGEVRAGGLTPSLPILQVVKFLDRQLGLLDEFLEETNTEFAVLGNGKRVGVIRLHHHDMGAYLTVDGPPSTSEFLHRVSA